jgi:murein L,D-transpeptidase YcbB/YkuD
MFVCRKAIGLLAGAAAMLAVAAAPAFAQEAKCEGEIKAAGEASVSRSLVSYPSSLFAWRREAEAKYGGEFRAWRNAQKRRIDCKQDEKSRLWVCTRTAVACTGKGVLAAIGVTKPPVLTARLKLRDRGDQVKVLQELLNSHGYNLEVDGNFGSGTHAAVRDFQKREGLKVDGIVGTMTRERLQS